MTSELVTWELLRRAAAKLRDATKHTTEGPWIATTRAPRIGAVATIDARTHIVARLWRCDSHPDAADADGRYIALMHPPVAAAVADWLDMVARATKKTPGFTPAETVDAIARAILREEDE